MKYPTTTVTIVLKPEAEALLRSLDAKLGRMLAADPPDVTECATATDIPERMSCVAAREMLREHIRALIAAGSRNIQDGEAPESCDWSEWRATVKAAEALL